jgi:DNA modification methylase
MVLQDFQTLVNPIVTDSECRLSEENIEYSTKPGDLVVDPFAGSFSTGRAADLLGRNCVGFDLNPAAVQAFQL